jgi:transcriptional regulator NrdR family protein
MKCPYCDGKTRVSVTRPTTEAVERFRACTECYRTFTTEERVIANRLREPMATQWQGVVTCK